jgi:hypothetical protein
VAGANENTEQDAQQDYGRDDTHATTSPARAIGRTELWLLLFFCLTIAHR